MKSKLTIAELQAQAMLLGMRYDPNDHTFFIPIKLASALEPLEEYDADTLERIEMGGLDSWQKRKKFVKNGEIGAKDYGAAQMSYDGEDD